MSQIWSDEAAIFLLNYTEKGLTMKIAEHHGAASVSKGFHFGEAEPVSEYDIVWTNTLTFKTTEDKTRIFSIFWASWEEATETFVLTI